MLPPARGRPGTVMPSTPGLARPCNSGGVRSAHPPLTLMPYPPTGMVPRVTSSDQMCPHNKEVVCTFDIVPSPDPLTRALIAEASIFHNDVSGATVRQWHPLHV
ncbi:hypothetical protein C2845_PM13G24150 [Panicum miliaceum]|uniref:Uncharacterized protein n=1 Tax=Panicum miliaceum TaxID=4540 RepID=A0A3L6RH65_PANMI|nr:hypothetical protein C2845_PM13G24150 [Panicum miliaceum]